MYWTDDPVRDAERYFSELEEKQINLTTNKNIYARCCVCEAELETDYDANEDDFGDIYCHRCWAREVH